MANATECTITMFEIYWDNTGPSNEGWAWRITMTDSRYVYAQQESGAMDENDLKHAASNDELREAVESLAFYHDVDINAEDVAAECTRDGGYAVWNR